MYVSFTCVPLKQLKAHLKFTANLIDHLGSENEVNMKSQWLSDECGRGYVQRLTHRTSESHRCCYSMSSGRTGWGRGMIDFFSVSLDNAFLMSETGNSLSCGGVTATPPPPCSPWCSSASEPVASRYASTEVQMINASEASSTRNPGDHSVQLTVRVFIWFSVAG